MPGKENLRPVYLDLLRIRLPVGGVISILHRITGVILVLLLPLGFYLLQQSLASAERYAELKRDLLSLPARILVFFVALVLLHHFLAGLRHLLLDLDIGIARAQARASAWLVILGVVSLGAFLGWRLFL